MVFRFYCLFYIDYRKLISYSLEYLKVTSMLIAQKPQNAPSAATERSTTGSILGYPKAFLFLFYIWFWSASYKVLPSHTPKGSPCKLHTNQQSSLFSCDKAGRCRDLSVLDNGTDLIFIFAKQYLTDSYCKMYS